MSGAALIDSHAHLDMLDDLDGALARARQAAVEGVVAIGVDEPSSRWAAETAARDGVWATVGLHPHDAKDWTKDLGDLFEELSARPGVVGIGEAGLDYYYDRSPRRQQRAVFAEHIRLAHRTHRALVVHCRDAFDDVFAVLEHEDVPPRTVFHCWSGGAVEAGRALALGAVLSFSGTVTFKNADNLREAALVAPAERIVVETDAPFLAPVPMRGRPNEPAYVAHTATFLAGLRSEDPDAFAAATVATTRRLFALT